MSILAANCPRCGTARTTFDVKDATVVYINYNWQAVFEAACVCRTCGKYTIFVVKQKEPGDGQVLGKIDFFRTFAGSINDYVNVDSFINIKDLGVVKSPEHLPEDIGKMFQEGSACLAVGCPNAAGAMFRTCVDMATRRLLPEGEVEGLNGKVRRDLGLRLPWLFQHGFLAKDLENLSRCIREDGNDGVHAGTLLMEDAQDLIDFARALLERLYTEPARLKIAEARREARRQPKG